MIINYIFLSIGFPNNGCQKLLFFKPKRSIYLNTDHAPDMPSSPKTRECIFGSQYNRNSHQLDALPRLHKRDIIFEEPYTGYFLVDHLRHTAWTGTKGDRYRDDGGSSTHAGFDGVKPLDV